VTARFEKFDETASHFLAAHRRGHLARHGSGTLIPSGIVRRG
jgi:hypothetical protein